MQPLRRTLSGPRLGLEQSQRFCCLGCQTVFSLLHENGLGRYYALEARARHPHPRRPAAGNGRFWTTRLVADKLFDFTDGDQARVTLHLPAIHCVACVWLLENLFKLHPGVGPFRGEFFPARGGHHL